MKYFKYVFVILLMLIMSGCSIDYTLFISDKGFDEEINVNVIDNLENTEFAEKDYNPLHHSDSIFYDKKVKKSNENIDIKLHYNYSLEEFNNANSFNQAFYNKNIKITVIIIKNFIIRIFPPHKLKLITFFPFFIRKIYYSS